MAEKKSGLWAKVLAVQSEVGMVEKKGYNDHFKYDYAKEEDFLAAVKPLLEKHKLTVSQVGAEQQVVGSLTLVATKYRITDTETDEHEIITGIGQGSDSGDKGGYKAMTGSMKYFIAKFFLIPTGDDPEKEEKVGRAKKGAAAKPPASARPGATAAPAAGKSAAETALGMIAKTEDEKKLKEWRDKAKSSKVYTPEEKKKVVAAIDEKLRSLGADEEPEIN